MGDLHLGTLAPCEDDCAQLAEGGIEVVVKHQVVELLVVAHLGDRLTEAAGNKIYYGPVYFRRESEPYMTLSLAGTRRDAGVSIAEVNLKLIWDVVSQIKVGEKGSAYVIDRQGRLIARGLQGDGIKPAVADAIRDHFPE